MKHFIERNERLRFVYPQCRENGCFQVWANAKQKSKYKFVMSINHHWRCSIYFRSFLFVKPQFIVLPFPFRFRLIFLGIFGLLVNSHDFVIWLWYGLPLFSKLAFPIAVTLLGVAKWLEHRIDIHGLQVQVLFWTLAFVILVRLLSSTPSPSL